MANHNLAVGVYSRAELQTYVKSLKDSESVEKVTSSFLGHNKNIKAEEQKSHFDEVVEVLPDLR